MWGIFLSILLGAAFGYLSPRSDHAGTFLARALLWGIGVGALAAVIGYAVDLSALTFGDANWVTLVAGAILLPIIFTFSAFLAALLPPRPENTPRARRNA